MSDETQAIDVLADFFKTIAKGWPIYGVVLGILWGYGDLWLDKKIANAIDVQTLEVPAIVTMTSAVQTNTNSINRVEVTVGEVQDDTQAILLHLAGVDDGT